MKKFRALLAIMAVCALVVSMSMVVFADDVLDAVVFNADSVEFAGAAGDTIVVAVYSGATEIDVIQGGAIRLHYDTDKWEYTSVAYNTNLSPLDNVDEDADGCFKLVPNVNATVIIPANTKIADVTFTAKTDDSSSEFILNHYEEWDLYASAGEPYYDYNDTLTVTQKAAASADPATVALTAEDANATIAGAKRTYAGIWKGTYTVNLNGNKIAGINVAFNNKTETVEKVAEGNGTAVFSIAILKAEEAPVVTVVPFAAQ